MPESSLRLAVNLAYLRFETFEHRERIKKDALEKGGIADEIPDKLKESTYCKRLSYWTGISRDPKAIVRKLGRGRWHPIVFDTHNDRKASKIMVLIAFSVFLAGTLDVSGVMRIPGQTEWFGSLLALLEIMTVASVTLVLGGNADIPTACSLIDEDAEQWRIFMRDQTPE